ncbi:hypothetical protein WJX81_002091 [Elliptochloris bilobata]|uniref:EF-hand domain-containing protein n=1 Tax=Elliptochloris bilobata TaxID=381761 RepID=A0AAW1RZF4_9CHLO
MKAFFSKGKEKKESKKKVDAWRAEETARWLGSIGLQHYAPNFQRVDGKALLALSVVDIYERVPNKSDADACLAALDALHRREAHGSQPARSQPSTAEKPVGGAAPADSAGAPSSGAARGQGAADSAEALARLVPGSTTEVTQELYAFLNHLNISGLGLVAATERSPLVSLLVNALWGVHDLAQGAKGNHALCMELDAYMQDILRVFDAEGKRLAAVETAALKALLAKLEAAHALVQTCSEPGWLQRMAVDEGACERFQEVHNDILALLRAERLDTLQTGRQLSYGAYHDQARPLRRVLKQVGAGSLDAGLAAVRTDEAALREVAAVISADPKAILNDVRSPAAEAPGAQAAGAKDADAQPSLAPAASKELQAVFSQYDKAQSGSLGLAELRNYLADTGALGGLGAVEADTVVRETFAAADADGDGRLSPDEFAAFCSAHAAPAGPARPELLAALGPAAEGELKKVFCSFASFGGRQHVEEMDGGRFEKLCRDCGLVDRKAVTSTEVDLAFARAKAKGARRLTFERFLDALALLAERKGTSLADLAAAVLAARGPCVSGTRADYVKFHDDKSTYTGVYARGGPTNVDPSKDLSALLDRSPADVRGIKKPAAASQNDPPPASVPAPARPPAIAVGGSASALMGTLTAASPGAVTGLRGTPSPGVGSGRSAAGGAAQRAAFKDKPAAALSPTEAHDSQIQAAWDPVQEEELQAAFRAFTLFGHGAGAAGKPAAVGMDGRSFAKLARECGLLGPHLTPAHVDIVFSKVKAKWQGARRICFADFQRGVELLAEARGCDAEAVRRAVVLSGGPHANTHVTPDYVRLHDDKSTYSGVYAKGGPSTVDKRITLASLTARSDRPDSG